MCRILSICHVPYVTPMLPQLHGGVYSVSEYVASMGDEYVPYPMPLVEMWVWLVLVSEITNNYLCITSLVSV